MDYSPFWTLSAELRNEIYDLASTTPGGVFIEFLAEGPRGHRTALKPRTCQRHPLAMTAVSKQMREESRGAFFAVNDVSLILPMLNGDVPAKGRRSEHVAVRRWLHGLHPKDRAALKSVELDIGSWSLKPRLRRVQEPKPQKLAAGLLALARIFDADGVGAVAWITMTDLDPYDPRVRLSMAFRLSVSDARSLKAVDGTVIKPQVDKCEAEYRAGVIEPLAYRFRSIRLLSCTQLVYDLADALERLMT